MRIPRMDAFTRSLDLIRIFTIFSTEYTLYRLYTFTHSPPALEVAIDYRVDDSGFLSNETIRISRKCGNRSENLCTAYTTENISEQ